MKGDSTWIGGAIDELGPSEIPSGYRPATDSGGVEVDGSRATPEHDVCPPA